jgi:putative endonuclease
VNASGAAAERRVRRHYRLRGYRIVATNVWASGYEVDIVARRGRQLVFCEVKFRAGEGFGGAREAVGAEKERRVRRAVEGFLARHPELADLEVALEVAAVSDTRIERLRIFY